MKEIILKPRSKFLLVKCPKCGAEQIVYNHSKMKVECRICNTLLVKPGGGKAKIYGRVLQVMG